MPEQAEGRLDFLLARGFAGKPFVDRRQFIRCRLVAAAGEFCIYFKRKLGQLLPPIIRPAVGWVERWRGQGGSERPRRLPSRPRPRRFDRDAVELALFARTIPAAGWPRILIGHSMGGAIALLCLRRYPGSFDAAILSAPMLGIRTGGVPSPLVRGISSLARAAGLGMCFVPGAGAWQPDRVPSPERSRVSNDPERCRLQCAWFLEHAALRVDEPTWGWLDASLRLAARLARKEESTFRSCSPAQDWRLLYRPPPIAVPPGCYRTAPWSSCRLRSTNPFLSATRSAIAGSKRSTGSSPSALSGPSRTSRPCEG